MSKFNSQIESFENERQAVLDKEKTIFPIVVLLPLFALCFFIYGISNDSSFLGFITLQVGIITATLLYYLNILIPFKKLLSKVKAALLEDIMFQLHPDLEYEYFPESLDGEYIANKSEFFDFSSAVEEDVVKGKLNDTYYYISDLFLTRGSGKNRRNLFKGLLMKLNIGESDFPLSFIDTDGNRNRFDFNRLDKDTGIHYKSEDEKAFLSKLKKLFPFIKSIRNQSNRILVKAYGNEIIILIDTKLNFLDLPAFTRKQSLRNPIFAKNLSKHLNTMLYMVEALSQNHEESEIEKKLELFAKEVDNAKNLLKLRDPIQVNNHETR